MEVICAGARQWCFDAGDKYSKLKAHLNALISYKL